jgi:hypothetical protein
MKVVALNLLELTEAFHVERGEIVPRGNIAIVQLGTANEY